VAQILGIGRANFQFSYRIACTGYSLLHFVQQPQSQTTSPRGVEAFQAPSDPTLAGTMLRGPSPSGTRKSPQHLFFVLLLAARGKNRCCGDFCGNQSCFSLLGRDNCNGRHAARVSESSIETVICSNGSLAPIQAPAAILNLVNRSLWVRIPQPAKSPSF
jgi:hypothetical protein